MVLFWPSQQELDCINSEGLILGKIQFDGSKEEYIFCCDNESVSLSELEKIKIADRLAGLKSGKYSMPMQDDD
ncbi:hypothetical protein ACFOEK_11320 [Litoribrevibacter euphylliae]|uniref:Uncharacterized protein n=1 Tax=Litoribrevibacter euphylliae TaxID=1834034 RepID=A0ABV7HCN2_9GAMM